MTLDELDIVQQWTAMEMGDAQRRHVMCIKFLLTYLLTWWGLEDIRNLVCRKVIDASLERQQLLLVLQFYGHYTGQPVLAGTPSSELVGFCWSKVLLPTPSTFGLGRRC